MKVLLVSPLPPPAGGIATWTKKYIKYFKVHELNCEVVNTSVIGVRKTEINHKKNYIDEIKRAYNIYFDTKNKIKHFEPDIAHVNTSCTRMGVYRDYAVVSLLKKKRIPVILHCRCNIEDQLKGAVSRTIFSKMVHKATMVLTLNRESYNYVNSISTGKTAILPNFIESDRLFECRIIKDQIKKVLFVGHVWKPKGVIEIFETAKQFNNLEFILIGPVKDDIKTYAIPSNVKLLGEQNAETVKEKLLEADVFLFPSYTEGFANALAEAMAVGLPIITTPVGANEDMVEGKGGKIVPVGDVSAIVSALNSIKDRNIRKEMSDWNVQKVKRFYLIDSVMAELLSVYSEVISETAQDSI